MQRERKKRKRYVIYKGRVFAALAMIVGIVFLVVHSFAGEATAKVDEESSSVIVYDDRHTIVLDSGHGPVLTGAQGILKEEELTPIVTEYLYQRLLADDNYNVLQTHPYDEDLSLDGRVRYTRNVSPDLFISLHFNSMTQEYSDVSGFEIYAQLPENKFWQESYDFANLVVDNLVDIGHTPRKGSGLFYMRYEQQNGEVITYSLTEEEEEQNDLQGETLAVINNDDYLGVLLELGYVTSEYDCETWLTDSGMEKMADAVYLAICEKFGTEPVEV